MPDEFQTENRGHTDALVRNVWLGSFLFFAAFIGAVYLSIQVAGDAANNISTTREVQLVAFDVQRVAENTLAAQQRIVKSDSMFLETKVTEKEGRDFGHLIGRKLSREPFTLFGIIDDKGSLTFSSTSFSQSATAKTQQLASISLDLIQSVYNQFDEMKAPTENGYVAPSHFLYDEAAMTAFGFRYFDEKLVLIVAQPVLPITSYMQVETERPFVSIAAMPIPNLSFSQTAKKMGMRKLLPSREDGNHTTESVLDLPNGDIPPVAHLTWQATSPKTAILKDALPYLAVLSFIALASIALVGGKFTSVLNTLGYVNRRNRYLAQHCGLTKLANRSKFDELLRTACINCHVQPFTLIAIDLDIFKPLNDTYGHEAGDIILETVARRLETTVGEFGTVARVGGDEFMIILRENFGRALTEQLADELVELVAWPIPTPYGELTVGCSIGIANAPKDGKTDADLARRADEAMYYSKKIQGNTKTFAEDRVFPENADVAFQSSAG